MDSQNKNCLFVWVVIGYIRDMGRDCLMVYAYKYIQRIGVLDLPITFVLELVEPAEWAVGAW